MKSTQPQYTEVFTKYGYGKRFFAFNFLDMKDIDEQTIEQEILSAIKRQEHGGLTAYSTKNFTFCTVGLEFYDGWSTYLAYSTDYDKIYLVYKYNYTEYKIKQIQTQDIQT